MGNWDVELDPNKDGVKTKLDMSEEMTREEAIKWLKIFKGNTGMAELSQAFDVAIKALEQETSKDAVSRQVAIDAFSMFAEYESNRTNAEWVDRIRVVLSSLPPVQPISRWITVTDKLPSDCDEDWVLVQIQEDNGYLWIPRVMEYRKSKDDWWGEDIGWLKNSNGVFKVIAWMPLPKPYEPQESEERP